MSGNGANLFPGNCSEKSNQAMDLKESEDEEPNYAKVILNGIANA